MSVLLQLEYRNFYHEDEVYPTNLLYVQGTLMDGLRKIDEYCNIEKHMSVRIQNVIPCEDYDLTDPEVIRLLDRSGIQTRV